MWSDQPAFATSDMFKFAEVTIGATAEDSRSRNVAEIQSPGRHMPFDSAVRNGLQSSQGRVNANFALA